MSQILPTKKTLKVDSLKIPAIDKNANLKIENVQVVEEEAPPQEKKGVALFIFGSIFCLLVFAGVVTLAVLYLKLPQLKSESPIATAPTPVITEAPKVLKNSEITFEVLNASGIGGQAAKYKKQLETLGYTVSSIGNSNSNKTGLAIYTVNTLDDQRNILIADLKKEFPTATYSGVLTGSTTMVRLIIGK